MASVPSWPETESVVHQPSRWLAIPVGLFFIVVSVPIWAIFEYSQGNVETRCPSDRVTPELAWCIRAFISIFPATGLFAILWGLGGLFKRHWVRHAAPEVLSDVPREPVIWKGMVTKIAFQHRLVATPQGWELRPRTGRWSGQRGFLHVFWLLFVPFWVGLVAVALHSHGMVPSWPIAILAGAGAGLVGGLPVLLLIDFIFREEGRRLFHLLIPREGDLQLLVDTVTTQGEPARGSFSEIPYPANGKGRRCLLIPRHRVLAVQGCSCKCVIEDQQERARMWTVEGLLVLQHPEHGYLRVPLLMTQEFVYGARLLRQLAEVLQVPFLFHAGAAGWKARRAQRVLRDPYGRGDYQDSGET